MKLKSDNKGLTVAINFWSLEKYVEDFDSQMARLWVKGTVTNADGRESKKFNDAGDLIKILGKWNAAKFRQLKARH